MKAWHETIESLRIAFDSVRSNKLRSALATLGIVIGVFTATLMAAAIAGLSTSLQNSISAIGSDVVYIQRFGWGPSEEWWKIRARRPISLHDARRLAERATMAEAVSFEGGTGGSVTYRNSSATGVIVMGNTASSAYVRGLVVKEGRFFTEAEVDGERPVCVLGFELADRFFPYGSAPGEWISLQGRRYQIVGVLEKLGGFAFANLDNQVAIPVTRLVRDFSREPDLSIAIKIGDPEMLDEIQEELRYIMRTVRKVEPGEDDDFSINNQNALLDVFSQITTVVGTAGLSLTSLSLLVGGIGIMNVMFVSVTERTREIGVRKALGATRRAILTQFLLEAAVICVLGGIVALGLAWPVTLVVQNWLPARISPGVAGIALGVAALTGIIAGFLPAWRAARMNPVDALRSE
jgi:putative ABC transport system permease protein